MNALHEYTKASIFFHGAAFFPCYGKERLSNDPSLQEARFVIFLSAYRVDSAREPI
jgi:hypothetical protein